MTESECRCGNSAMEIIKHHAPESNCDVYYCLTCGRLKYLNYDTGLAGGLFNARPSDKVSVTWREPVFLQKLGTTEEALPQAEQPKPAEPPKEAAPPAQAETKKFKKDTVELLSRLKEGEFVQDESQEPNQEADDGKDTETG